MPSSNRAEVRGDIFARLALVCGFLTYPGSLSAQVDVAEPQQWKLVWSDDFDTPGLPDPTKWKYDVGGHGWGNQELQYYTEGRLENARVENGHLVIEARKEPWKGKEYTSARLVTKGKGGPNGSGWRYGKLEVKAKLPRGRGTWPAIWMLGDTPRLRWPDDGEIDIMEHVGFDQGKVHASVHCKKYYFSIGTQKTASVMVKNCSDEFHVYAVEWNSESVEVSVDGRVYFTFANEHTGHDAWPFDHRMYLLLNVAVGGAWGGQKGVDNSIWPQRMTVDYVRMHEPTAPH